MKRIQSSISLKLLITFLSVVILALLVLFQTLNALKKTREAQNKLTEEAFPMLRISQDLSQSLLDYLTLLERAAINQSNISNVAEKITLGEKTILFHLDALQVLNTDSIEVLSISSLLQEVFSASDDFLALTAMQRPKQIDIVDEQINSIRHDLSYLRRQIRHHQMTAPLSSENRMYSMNDQLVRIDEILGHYHYDVSGEELKHFESRYIVAVRNMTQQVLIISDSDTKDKMAKSIDRLFQQTTNSTGLFLAATSLAKNISDTEKIIQSNKNKEQEVNLMLGNFLELVGRRADIELGEFDSIIKRHISRLILVIILMFSAAALVIFFYVIPKITRRLDRLARDTQVISSGQYNIEIDTSGTDEIASMASALEGFKQSLIAKEKTDQRIRDREARLSNIFDNAVDGLITISQQGIIESFNPACEKIFGYSSDEAIGKNVSVLVPDDYQRKFETFRDKYHNSKASKFVGSGYELEARRKDASTFPIDLSISEVDIDGKIFFSGIIRDISTRKKLEDEREKLIEQLANSNEELERFAYVCSHDLQEPLRMIRSFSDRLQKHMGDRFENDKEGKQYFQFITDGAARAQDLIIDILAYSSIDNSTRALELVDCDELIQVVRENMRLYLEEKQGSITSDKLPVLQGNKTQLFQLFQNLINNGLKYQSAGNTPHVLVAVEDHGELWQFSIKDNGIGMETRYLKKIFDVFQRLHRRNEYAGTGVGLAICKKVVERHGGKIWVTSEKGVGSTFFFTILKT